MGSQRKKVIVDKKFQYRMSLKAAILPLIVILIISAVLLYYGNDNKELIKMNSKHIEEIVGNQDSMIDMFVSTPILQKSEDPDIKNGVKTFKNNIGKLKKISVNSEKINKNGSLIFYFLILMVILQSLIIFALFIFFSHKISGPIYVMTNYLKEIKKGNIPDFRPLRKNDEFKDFYNNFCETFDYIKKNYKKK